MEHVFRDLSLPVKQQKMTNFYCLAVVAEEVGTTSNKNTGSLKTNEFVYDLCTYKLLIDININQFINDIKKCPDFFLNRKTNHYDVTTTYLCIFFKSQCEVQSLSKSRDRLIERFFNLKKPTKECDPQKACTSHIKYDTTPDATNQEIEVIELEEIDTKRISEVSISSIYAMLRDAHLGDILEDRVSHIDSNAIGLNPELRFYQKDALNWMLHRELDTKYNQTDFFPISCVKDKLIREEQNHVFYFNARTLELLDRCPDDLRIPTGGILADEMGLGKTVEMLALILCNQRKTLPNLHEEDASEPEGNFKKTFVFENILLFFFFFF